MKRETVATPWLVALSLCQRELVRFFRQPNRVVGALAQPILFWVLFGAGFNDSFTWQSAAGESISYREYFFPGIVALIVLFSAIFATISIIEDRREGFLQAVLVAPVPAWSMVLGKMLGGSAVALTQAALFLLLGAALGYGDAWWAIPLALAFSFLLAVGLTGVGFTLAWLIDSTQGFHAIMSVLLFPAWLLSGAFFPMEKGILFWIGAFNPMTYGVAGLRRILMGTLSDDASGGPTFTGCVLAMTVFAAIAFASACWASRRRSTSDLL